MNNFNYYDFDFDSSDNECEKKKVFLSDLTKSNLKKISLSTSKETIWKNSIILF
jgi:hypothetical protein